jgi:ABC-2 type transport system ATP-binding protein
VNDVSFSVDRGEVLGFLGPNGAGKSTTMKVITGFLAPTGGTAVVCGSDIVTHPIAAKRHIGYLPEGAPAYPDMTPLAFLRFIARIRGFSGADAERRIELAINRTSLDGVLAQSIDTLSKGFKRRVGLAQALLHDPDVLILDEPTDGLDPGQKQEALGLLRELGRDHTIMLSSHLLSEVETLVQRVIIIRRGHLGFAKKLSELETDDVIVVEVRGPSDQVAVALRNTEGVAQVTTRSTDNGVTLFEIRAHQRKDLREQISQRIAKNGWPIRRLDLRRRNLQDRWNEINNWDEFGQRGAASAGPQPARRSDSTAVTT